MLVITLNSFALFCIYKNELEIQRPVTFNNQKKKIQVEYLFIENKGELLKFESQNYKVSLK